jgi:hypothetical protein
VDHALLAPATDLRVAVSANGLSLLALGIFPGFLLTLCARALT